MTLGGFKNITSPVSQIASNRSISIEMEPQTIHEEQDDIIATRGYNIGKKKSKKDITFDLISSKA